MERLGSRAALLPVTRTDVWGGGGGSEWREPGSREGQRHRLVGGKGGWGEPRGGVAGGERSAGKTRNKEREKWNAKVKAQGRKVPPPR